MGHITKQQAMTAAEWRRRSQERTKAAAQPLSLPSGMVVLARRPGAAFLASMGRLPLTLAGSLTGREQGEGEDAAGAAVMEGAAFLRELLAYVVVSPRISLEGGEDTIHPREIPDEDLTFLIRWAQRREEAESLETFRGGAEHGSAGGHGADVAVPAERAAGDHGSGAGAGSGFGGHGGSESNG